MPYVPPNNDVDYVIDENDVVEEEELSQNINTENEATYSPFFDYNGPSDIGTPTPSNPIVEPEDDTEYVLVYYYGRAVLTDYDPYYLKDLSDNGSIFYALYDDGTEEEVSWDEIESLDDLETEIDLSESLAAASNQHFWDDANGVHVAEVSREDWDTAVAANFSDLSSSKNYYNILMNSLGFLLRRALYNLVSINRAAISFYDGLGNDTTNIMASFGRSSTQIGRSEGKHVVINNDGITAYDGDNIAPLNASNITAAEANIRQLQANTADIATIRANSAKVDNLTAASLSAATGYVADLNTANVTASNLVADHASVAQLQTNTADIATIRANSAKVDNLTAASLSAATGYVADLNTANVTANNLVADHAAVSNLSTTYAQINGANINTAQIRDAWINNLLVQSNLIMHEGTAFVLDAIKVNADHITAGVIDVEHLVFTSDQGDKYMVHLDPDTQQTVYEKLDGNVIEDLTITADKIVAGAITTQKITTENLVGTGGWINLHRGTFNYYNGTTGQGISWDGQNLNISGSVTIGGNPILLSDVVENTLIYDHTYQFNNDHTEATFTAYLFRGGVDVKSEYQSSQFTWWYKTEDDQDPIYIDSGYTCDVSIAQMGYGGHIIGRFTSLQDANLQTSDGDNLLTSDEQEILTQTEEGGSIRISDLVVATNLRSSDKLIVSGPEGENLVTISTLQSYLETSIGKQVLFNTTNGWNTQSSLISQENKLYVYTDHATDSSGNPLAGIKVGDGNAYLIDIPFIDQLFTNHINDTSIHVTPAEKAFWNNKVSCYYAGLDTLVLTTN